MQLSLSNTWLLLCVMLSWLVYIILAEAWILLWVLVIKRPFFIFYMLLSSRFCLINNITGFAIATSVFLMKIAGPPSGHDAEFSLSLYIALPMSFLDTSTSVKTFSSNWLYISSFNHSLFYLFFCWILAYTDQLAFYIFLGVIFILFPNVKRPNLDSYFLLYLCTRII